MADERGVDLWQWSTQSRVEKSTAAESYRKLLRDLEASRAQCTELERFALKLEKEDGDEDQYASDAKQAMLMLETAAAVHKATVNRLAPYKEKAVLNGKFRSHQRIPW